MDGESGEQKGGLRFALAKMLFSFPVPLSI